MSGFDVNLVLLNQANDAESFLVNFHKHLATKNVVLEKEESGGIIFNDTLDGQERDPEIWSKEMTNQEVIASLCSWPGLGMLHYRHPDFSFPISIQYLTWTSSKVEAFTVGVNGKEAFSKASKWKKLTRTIFELVNYKLVVFDMGRESSLPIEVTLPKAEILTFIKNNSTVLKCLFR